MSPEVGLAAVDGTIRSAIAAGAQALKVKYGGGEPTLNLLTLQAAHEYARRRAEGPAWNCRRSCSPTAAP
jgi:sulfatase maturation enzyme AslB (radical SAM superfamily)